MSSAYFPPPLAKIKKKLDFHSKHDKQDFKFYSEEEKKKKNCVNVFFQSRHKDPSFLQAVCDKSHEACVLEGFITLA